MANSILMRRIFIPNFLLLLLTLLLAPSLHAQRDSLPNILLIIADDLGVDLSHGYHQGALMPTTPVLDSLRSVGITFEHVWSAPSCTPTRAAIMSGKYGTKTGVMRAPGHLDTSHISVFRALAQQSNKAYAGAVIGKWHISQPSDPLHPSYHGVDHYMGVLDFGVNDYNHWQKTSAGTTTTETNYATTVFTDSAIDWMGHHQQPWFLWLAHIAPHSPVHVPPSHMYTISGTQGNFRKYIAMIESLDYEIGRLLGAMPDSVKAKTVVMYLGDNGTPNNFLRDYPPMHGKGSLYQGGIRVPMIVAGAGVTRKGERESALVHVTDIHATILELAGASLPGGVYNSLSFAHLLKGVPGPGRDYNYIDFQDPTAGGWAIRTAQYKLINFTNGTQEMYDLWADSLEANDLLSGTLTPVQQLIKSDLESEAAQIRAAWSCKDGIQNGDEAGIDCGGTYCDTCQSTSLEAVHRDAVKVFPNPATDMLRIIREAQDSYRDMRVTLYNAWGQSLGTYHFAPGASELQLDLSELEAQVLWLWVYMDGHKPSAQAFKVLLMRY